MRNRTYSIEWSREDGKRLRCTGLSPRVLTSRLMVAVSISSPIAIHSVTADRKPRRSARRGKA